MTDREIINRLIAKDNSVTKDFFFVKFRPLFSAVIRRVFPYEVDYDEFVNELYRYLMDDDAAKLRSFGYRCPLAHWLKVVATRHFIKKRDMLINDSAREPLYNKQLKEAAPPTSTAKADLERIFTFMPNKRYVYVIRRLVIEDVEPESLAQEIGVTTANLYNIKRRAMLALADAAVKDIKHYGK